MNSSEEERSKALQFLRALNDRLMEACPPPERMRSKIRQLVENAKAAKNKTHHGPEYAFLNEFVTPTVFTLMKSKQEVTDETVKRALLSEWYRGLPQYHFQSPARRLSHPFEKLPRASTEVMRRWRGMEQNQSGGVRKPLHQPCPDLAIGNPFPKTVFEVKYFESGDAETQLVNSLYEAFYYLAMPIVPARSTHPVWDYDFGCLLAFDASVNGLLLEAWRSLTEEARRGFWEGANIFVMIIRPSLPPVSKS